ncbi:SLAP domain-containing protein [Schleiferilactobacillus perolens]|uniref:DUF5011 domain-containing protein n=1 Tax=Schleiferilactobacillus perolens DSM 12744 TaxID=1423792 RepID=A0A0R1MWJ9_9LACO|nr:SLAP domain-containing protein [Schleiferilactobacillus perolens]KRL12567.1 hypothetical protein FD09_GL002886 [Schleiferilactobacillus perolens DSM 12744]
MKNSSKVKYFGAVAAALLAVAPIAAPVVSQIASPAITQAADAADVALTYGQADNVKTQLNNDASSFVISHDQATKNVAAWQSWVNANAQNNTSTSNMPNAKDWLGTAFNTATSGNPFVKTATTGADIYSPKNADNSKANVGLSYTVSGGYGNQLSASSQTQQIATNLQLASIAQDDSTYNITVTAYDVRTQQPLKDSTGATVQKSYSVTIQGTSPAQATVASGTFKPVNIKAGDKFPGVFADTTSAAGDITLTVNGKPVAINVAQDVEKLGYAQSQPADIGTVTLAMKNGIDVLGNYINKETGSWTGNGVAYQVAQLASNNQAIVSLKDSLKNTKPALLGGDLWSDGAGNLFLVRPVTITDSDYNQALPTVFYQYQATPAKPVQYWDGSTVYLTTDDDAALNKSGALLTPDLVAAAVRAVAVGKNLTAKQSSTSDDPIPTADGKGSVTSLADLVKEVKAAAAAAGVNIGSSSNQFDKSASVLIPVTFTNAANLKTTVKIPVTLDATTQGAPVFTFAQGWVQNPTVQVGQQFKATEGISAWTDSKLNTAIDPVDWKIDGSVDTSKAGIYNLTYTITNPTTGKTAQLKRTVTVTASDKSVFENTNGVISIQTSKAPQYTYDSASDSFKVADSYTQLKLASAWKYNQKATTTNGDVYYRVSANGYVKATDVTTAKVTPQFGVVTVNTDNGTKTYANTTKDSGAVQSIKPDTAWKFFAVAVNPDGSRAYLVADNQWIPASDVVERVQSASGVFTVGSDVAPTFNGSGSVVKGKTLKARSAWKVTGVKNINGQPYYRIATDLYVRADYGSYAK